MKQKELLQHIKDNSICLNQLSYDKLTGNSYELRAKTGGFKTFILYQNPESDYWNIYLSEGNEIAKIENNFNNF